MSHQLAAGLHRSREGLGISSVPPDGIPGPPSPQSSNTLRSLHPTGLQEVEQLTWQFHLDSVSTPHPGKVSPQSGPTPLGGRGV
jgi:hypothetical protein